MITHDSRAPAVSADLWLTIDRLACHINLPAGLDDPVGTRDRLTRLAQREVAQVCGAALASLPGNDEAVYRIRHLHLDLWVDLQGMSEAEIARRWGRLLAAATMRIMRLGRPQHVVRFDSPRHFVAAFLRDLLDGRAWSRWYYAEFRPLQRLSPAAIAVQLLAPRPDWIAPVLMDLATTGHTARLIERWGSDDIAQLWMALGFPPQPVLTPQAAEMTERLAELRALWPQVALSGTPERAGRARDRLRLWLALGMARPAAARDPALASWIHALVDLAALLRVEPNLAPVLLMESGLYPAVLKRITVSPLADTLGWLAPLSATAPGHAHLAHLAEVASARACRQVTQQTAQASPTEKAGADRWLIDMALSSPVGSVFLLAPALAEVGLWERWQEELGEETARRYVFILALKALGRERTSLLLGDRVLAAFAGLDEPPVADVRRPSEGVCPEHSRREGPPEAWAAALPEIAARWYPTRDRDLTVGTTHGIHILRDAAGAYWLAARPVNPDEGVLDQVVQGLELATDLVRCDLDDQEQATLTAEAAHLQLGRRLGYPWLTPPLDAALSATTSLVLRRTAARLPGFARASPPYLAGQFLAQPATLHPGPEALTVRLSGGPLAVVLRLAALPDSLDVPWLSQPLCLTLPGGLGTTV